MVKHQQRSLMRRGRQRKEHEKQRKGASSRKAQQLENIGMMAAKGVDESARVYEMQFEQGHNKPVKGKEEKHVSSKNKAVIAFMNQQKNAQKSSAMNGDDAKHTSTQQHRRRLNIDTDATTKQQRSSEQPQQHSSSSMNDSVNSSSNMKSSPSSTEEGASRENVGSVHLSRPTRGALVTAIKTGNLDLVPDTLKGLSKDHEFTKAKLKKKVYWKMKKEKEMLKKLKKNLNKELALEKSKVKKHKMKNAKFEDLDEFLDEKEYLKNERKKREALMTLEKDEVADEVTYDSDDMLEQKRDEVAFGEVAQEPPRLSKLRSNLEKKIEKKKQEDVEMEKMREAERKRVMENYNRNRLLRQQQKEAGTAPTEQSLMLDKLKSLAALRSMKLE
ncbi:hypothetical protein C9374_007944 [Naegleria lovaniensis]|uniref:Uncharacterized protein n=1 Tax=Naegleria lovaniensis TaxID=51637 RepID=A0AA88GKD9_NAELO|nr:uncharacterized protein C9374_007944 [Naegleria lovaniensis]KAG2378796.1 hypothetical protein C9374_007944 [Naegleria lovaniensis]